MNILAIVADRYTACEEYRVTQPLQELEKLGHKILIAKDSGISKLLKRKANPFNGIDLLLFNRVVMSSTYAYNEFVKLCRDRGIAVVVDYDDDYTQKYRVVHQKQLPDLREASALTFSTDHLRIAMGGMNKHNYIIPNCLQMERFTGHKKDTPYPTIGFSGSTTHAIDWAPAAEGLAKAFYERTFSIMCSGMIPHQLSTIPVLTPNDLDASFGLTVPYTQYPRLIAQYDFLIGAVDPQDRFNWSKSNLKFLEAAASRVVFIGTGSTLPIYQEAREFYHLVDDHNNPDAWKTAILNAVDYPPNTKPAYDFVAANYSAPVVAKQREHIYNLIVDRERRRAARH